MVSLCTKQKIDPNLIMALEFFFSLHENIVPLSLTKISKHIQNNICSIASDLKKKKYFHIFSESIDLLRLDCAKLL